MHGSTFLYDVRMMATRNCFPIRDCRLLLLAQPFHFFKARLIVLAWDYHCRKNWTVFLNLQKHE